MATATTHKPSARERLLAAADELFYSEGTNTVGIDRVIEHAGVAKASLYKHFRSKDELILAYLGGRHDAWLHELGAVIEAHAGSPRDQLLAIYDAQARLFAQPGFAGCAFGNAAAEVAPGSPIAQAADDFRAWLNDLFAGLVAGLGVADPARLTRRLVLLYDGASTGAVQDHDPGTALVARDTAAALIDQALAGAG